MTKIGGISGKDVIKALEKFRFYQARQRGSHIIMRKDLPRTLSGPLQLIAIGSLSSGVYESLNNVVKVTMRHSCGFRIINCWNMNYITNMRNFLNRK